MAPMVLLSESRYPPQDDVLHGPLPIAAHQSSGYEHVNISASILPERYPFPYEDNYEQRFQVNTGADSGISGFENGPPTAYPELPAPRGGTRSKHNGRHHSRHHYRHYRHQSQPPQRYEHESSHATPPISGYGYSSPGHTPWEPDPTRSPSRSGSFAPIPSVYREPDSIGDSYASPIIQDNSAHLTGSDNHTHSLHRDSDGLRFEFDRDYGPSYTQQPAMIGWLSSTTEKRTDEEPQALHDPEATLVGESEPQIISPYVGGENGDVYRTCETDYEPNTRHCRRRALAQNYAHEVSVLNCLPLVGH